MAANTTIPDYPTPGLWERGLDIIFPPTCVGCRRTGRWICRHCWPSLDWLADTNCGSCDRPWPRSPCPHCGKERTSLDGVAAVTAFDGTAREAVHALKYHGRHAIGGMMGKLMAASLPPLELTMVVPVPLHPKRRRERGYDQAAILAGVIARALELPCESEALRRVRPTRQQATLDAEARRRNVAGAFAAETWVEGERALLIDDVMTTGVTLESASGALREAGALSVFGLVFSAAL